MDKLTMAGGGVLGSQIGFQSAYKGKDVTFWLLNDEEVEKTKEKITSLRDTYIEELEGSKAELDENRPIYADGLFDDFASQTPEKIDTLIEKVEKAYEGIKYETDLAKAVEDADLIIEAIAEIEDVKRVFYRDVAQHLPEKTILASNSSTMVPSTFAEDTGRPEKYLHLHFANRIWAQNLAEVMVHEGTDPKVKEAVIKFAKEIGMVPVVIEREQPGYLLNALLVPFLSAAQELLVNKIASHEDIDIAWKKGTGAPNGPFEVLDVVGMVTPLNIRKAMPDAEDPDSSTAKIIELLEKMIDEGWLGRASGQGFYKYDEDGKKIG